MVGRMGPTGSGFALAGLERRDGRVSSARVSLFTGLGVGVAGGVSATAWRSPDARVFVVAGGAGLSSRPAASAPAFRISSSVGVVEIDFFSRNFRFEGCDRVGDSDGNCSGSCGGASDSD
jgi:hypothetical protein